MTSKTIVRLRAKCYEAQFRRCYYCGVCMWINDLPAFTARFGAKRELALPLQCTAEHLNARSDGGRDVAGNIVAACRLCNSRRHRRKVPPTPEHYRQLVAARVEQGKWHSPRVFELGMLQRHRCGVHGAQRATR